MATGPLKRPTLVLIVLALVVAALFALVAWDASRPLTGDWEPRQEFVHPRVRMRLRRLTVLPWSQAIPLIAERGLADRAPLGPDDLYLLVELGIEVDGIPIYAEPGMVESVTQTEVAYNGKAVNGFRRSGAYAGGGPDSTVEMWYGIAPWKRGFGSGEFFVRKALTLKDGETIAG